MRLILNAPPGWRLLFSVIVLMLALSLSGSAAFAGYTGTGTPTATATAPPAQDPPASPLSPHDRFLLTAEGPLAGERQSTQPFPGESSALPDAPCTEWYVVPSPNAIAEDNGLSDVEATSPNAAWAVGSYFDPTSGAGGLIIERWNGVEWTIYPTSPLTGTLEGLAGVSDNDVWAVGYQTNGPGFKPLIMHWNGASWTVIPSPIAGTSSVLYEVSALSATDVWAVGRYFDGTAPRTLTMHWDGAAWSVIPSPNANDRDNTLFSVSALAPNDVWAVGDTEIDLDRYKTLIMHWNGAAWSIVPSPNIPNHDPSFTSNHLRDVRVVSATDVWAVGAYVYNSTDSLRPLALRWNGVEWNAYYTPYVTVTSVFYAVAPVSANEMYAVGYSGGGFTKAAPLTMRWDGALWTRLPTPFLGPEDNNLFGADAVGPIDVWAAGRNFTSFSHSSTYIIRYGTHECGSPTPTRTPPAVPTPSCDIPWSVVAPPTGRDTESIVNGMSVISPNDIWAVGTSVGKTLAMHWDGATWSVVPSPSPGTFTNILYGLTVVSPTDIWAVGSYSNGWWDRTLTLHWDGAAWSIVPSPNPATGNAVLRSVSHVSAGDIWAVGWQGYWPFQPLTMHWNGVAWSIVPTPSITGSGNTLHGVAAIAPNDVWAVGGKPGGDALAIHWDGAQWVVVPTPYVPFSPSELWAVTALSANDVWAVGGGSRPYILHWNGAAWTISPAPDIFDGVLYSVSFLSPTSAWAVGEEGSIRGLTLVWDGSTWTEAAAPYLSNWQSLNAAGAVAPGDAWAGGYIEPLRRMWLLRYTPCSLTPTPTPTPCTSGTFSDVPPDSTFYPYVNCLANRGIVTGYADCTFRPNNHVTRGQLSKIVALSAALNDPPTGQFFEDVPPGSTFYPYIQNLASRDIMAGYPCGTLPEEPCGPGNLPYFRPNTGATRGQLTKIVSNTAGFTDDVTGRQSFQDVPPGSAFHLYVERLLLNRPGVMSGYPCGGAGEPCGPDSLPYFRPNSPLTRGQTSKIVSNTFFPGCQAQPLGSTSYKPHLELSTRPYALAQPPGT